MTIPCRPLRHTHLQNYKEKIKWQTKPVFFLHSALPEMFALKLKTEEFLAASGMADSLCNGKIYTLSGSSYAFTRL